MEQYFSFSVTIISAIFISFLFIFLNLFSSNRRYKNLPPSPPSYPIIGHLRLLKEPIHRTLQQLSIKYGPILNLSLGTRNVLLISSPSAVEECFTKNDVTFANRPNLLAGKYLNYDFTTIGASSYGHHWRNVRRIASLEIFSTQRLNKFLGIRQDEVKLLLKNLFQNSRDGFTKVEMKSKLSDLSFNIIMRMVAGKRYFGGKSGDLEDAESFREIVRETFELSGASNPADFLPILRSVDYQSFEKRMKVVEKKVDLFMQSLIDEHRNKEDCPEDGVKNKTLIDSMLSLQKSEPENYSDDIIKGMILNLMVAGTDTNSVTTEWAMSLLLNNPTVLHKAKAEIDSYVGHDRLVDESDLSKLHYVQNIINETLRLYPAAPLLVPHESSDQCTIGGYDVPRSTMLIVNAWALQRDPNVWEDPTSFKPERFQGLVDGESSYKLIPFGLGRRSCPGVGLAHRVMGLALASLLQCFEWERISEEEVDMTEGTGLTMPKAKPLEAMCRARDCMVNVLSQL